MRRDTKQQKSRVTNWAQRFGQRVLAVANGPVQADARKFGDRQLRCGLGRSWCVGV